MPPFASLDDRKKRSDIDSFSPRTEDNARECCFASSWEANKPERSGTMGLMRAISPVNEIPLLSDPLTCTIHRSFPVGGEFISRGIADTEYVLYLLAQVIIANRCLDFGNTSYQSVSTIKF